MEQSHDYDHFVESVGEQLMLMLWTSIATLTGVGIILWIALQCTIIVQRGSTMTEQIPEGYVTSTVLDDGEIVFYGVFDTLDKAVKFGSNLINFVPHPIYPPSLH